MLIKPLPLLMVLPHAGCKIPEASKAHLQIPEEQLPCPVDAVLREILDLSHRIHHWVAADVHPRLIDVDQPENQAVRERLEAGGWLYTFGKRLPQEMKNKCLEEFYRPFHRALRAAVSDPEVCMGVEVRIMADPPKEKDPASMVLSNGGDRHGEPRGLGKKVTCPPQWLRDFRDLVAAHVAEERKPVLLNTAGGEGYLGRTYARPHVPWVRIDIPAAELMSHQGGLAASRLTKWHARFEGILSTWCVIQGYGRDA